MICSWEDCHTEAEVLSDDGLDGLCGPHADWYLGPGWRSNWTPGRIGFAIGAVLAVLDSL